MALQECNAIAANADVCVSPFWVMPSACAWQGPQAQAVICSVNIQQIYTKCSTRVKYAGCFLSCRFLLEASKPGRNWGLNKNGGKAFMLYVHRNHLWDPFWSQPFLPVPGKIISYISWQLFDLLFQISTVCKSILSSSVTILKLQQKAEQCSSSAKAPILRFRLFVNLFRIAFEYCLNCANGKSQASYVVMM